MSIDTLFPAAICRGKFEHKDGTHFFGSLVGYSDHMTAAMQLRLVDQNGTLTELGIRVGKECADIPHGRAVFHSDQYRAAAARVLGEGKD